MRLNSGLDIINTLCKYYKFNAPIFIDDCEGINEVLETESQQIRLCVVKPFKNPKSVYEKKINKGKLVLSEIE